MRGRGAGRLSGCEFPGASQDEAGKALEGFGAADCLEVFGNEIGRVVRWKSGSNLASLAGKSVRLRLAMKDCDLYALRFFSSAGAAK